jgi:hypothetical protein
MSALLRAEARKILTTRSTLVVAGFVVAYPALGLLPAVLASQEPEVDSSTILQVLREGRASSPPPPSSSASWPSPGSTGTAPSSRAFWRPRGVSV